MMLSLFFKCPICKDPPSSKKLPFCEECAHLDHRPLTLCGICFRDDCKCLPDSQKVSRIYALHLSIAKTHQKIRFWKSRKSPLWDRHLLRSEFLRHPVFESLRTTDAKKILIPISQNLKRSFDLGGNPALALAQWLSQQTGLQLRNGIFLDPPPKAAQAKKSAFDRIFAQKPELKIRAQQLETNQLQSLRGSHVILVDDLCTTGGTLQNHAQVLLNLGVSQVDGFVLGYRPKGLTLTTALTEAA